MTTWHEIGMNDTGNGALLGWAESADYPGIRQYDFASYCGREADRTWYEAINDRERLEYTTPAAAVKRYQQVVREADQSREVARLKKQLAAR